MPVSEVTAARAVKAWSLRGHKAAVTGCGCRYWQPVLPTSTARKVFACPAHRLPDHPSIRSLSARPAATLRDREA